MAFSEMLRKLFRNQPANKVVEQPVVEEARGVDKGEEAKYIVASEIVGDKTLKLWDLREITWKLGGEYDPGLYITVEKVDETEFFDGDFLNPYSLHYFRMLGKAFGNQRGDGEVRIPVKPIDNKNDLFIDPSSGWQFKELSFLPEYGMVLIQANKGDAATGQKVAVQALSKKR
ncbi:MAG: hypothetical protein A2959_04080 [Candidatus Levybacteria bacterium RIFCSPLOWO2_01_FULL_38_23]|nr:MAG: hypothetical protein A2959_04080 [Candidatus Levybacteria bacterium RIFCSPLOWO2_01_FULL_38_23]